MATSTLAGVGGVRAPAAGVPPTASGSAIGVCAPLDGGLGRPARRRGAVGGGFAPRAPSHGGFGRRRRRLGASTAGSGCGSGRRRRPGVDVGQTLQTLEAPDHTGGRGVGLGEHGPDERELEREPRRRRPAHVGLGGQQQRDHPRELGRRELVGLGTQRRVRVGRDVEQVLLVGRGLDEQQVAEVGQRSRPSRCAGPGRPAPDGSTDSNAPRRSPTATASASSTLDLGRRRAQQRPDHRFVDRRRPPSTRGLVQQRQRVARRPLRLPGDREGGRRVELDALGLGDRDQLLGQVLHGSAGGSRTAGSARRSWPASCAARWSRARTARRAAAPRRASAARRTPRATGAGPRR